MTKKHISGLFVKLRGPSYSDGNGYIYTVELDGDWGSNINIKNEPSISIKQGYGDDYVRIELKHAQDLIEDLQEALSQTSGYDLSPR